MNSVHASSSGLRSTAALRASACICALFLCAAAVAADFPTKPIHLVIGYAPGGTTDLIGRIYAAGMQRRLGQPLVVENRPGAAAAIAREQVARAAPDGYTLVTDATSLPGYAVFTRNPTLDVQKAFAPVSLLTESTAVLVARSDAPFGNFQDMIAYAKRNPGRLNYSGIGAGVILLTFESAKIQYGADIVAIDYKSSADDYRALLMGEVQLTISTTGRVAGDARAGTVKVMAVSGNERHPSLPNSPSARELGFNGFYSSWQGLWAPAGTPAEIIRELHAAAAEAASTKEVRDGLDKLEQTPLATPPEGLAQRMDRDIQAWREIVKTARIPLL